MLFLVLPAADAKLFAVLSRRYVETFFEESGKMIDIAEARDAGDLQETRRGILQGVGGAFEPDLGEVFVGGESGELTKEPAEMRIGKFRSRGEIFEIPLF